MGCRPWFLLDALLPKPVRSDHLWCIILRGCPMKQTVYCKGNVPMSWTQGCTCKKMSRRVSRQSQQSDPSPRGSLLPIASSLITLISFLFLNLLSCGAGSCVYLVLKYQSSSIQVSASHGRGCRPPDNFGRPGVPGAATSAGFFCSWLMD